MANEFKLGFVIKQILTSIYITKFSIKKYNFNI